MSAPSTTWGEAIAISLAVPVGAVLLARLFGASWKVAAGFGAGAAAAEIAVTQLSKTTAPAPGAVT